MEPAVEVWRRRAEEAWIEGVAPAALRDAVEAWRGLQRVLVVERDPLAVIASAIAALTSETPVELFLGSPRWSEAEKSAAEVLVRAGVAHEPPATRIMIPTGGTTGGLRFVAHTWETLAAAARGLQRALGGGPIDSVCFLPLHHVSGLMQVVRSFATGGRLTLAEWGNLERGEFPRLGRAGAVTSLVPTQLARLLEVSGACAWLRGFRAVFLGGAPAWPVLLDRARAERLPLAPCYGSSETAAQVTMLSPEEFLADAEGAGRALPHARIEIVDDATGSPLAPGGEGRIRVRARSLFCGYHPDVAGPAEAFLTGDRGVLAPDGRLTVLGRADAAIVTGGEKVAPSEVEAAIRATGLVADVAVLGVPDDEWGEVVVAMVAGAGASLETVLRERLRAALAPHKIPKRWVFLSALPRTEAGKVARAALLAAAGSRIAPAAGSISSIDDALGNPTP